MQVNINIHICQLAYKLLATFIHGKTTKMLTFNMLSTALCYDEYVRCRVDKHKSIVTYRVHYHSSKVIQLK